MSLFLDKTKLYIVGGINNQSYVSSSVECLETDCTLVPDIDANSEDPDYIDSIPHTQIVKLVPFKIPSRALKNYMNDHGYLNDTSHNFNKVKKPEVIKPKLTKSQILGNYSSVMNNKEEIDTKKNSKHRHSKSYDIENIFLTAKQSLNQVLSPVRTDSNRSITLDAKRETRQKEDNHRKVTTGHQILKSMFEKGSINGLGIPRCDDLVSW